jgi:endonuclease/exonuclease/phosphatase family metal-dependent hydrolase
MSDYYKGLYGSHKKEHKSPFAALLDAVVFVITVVVAVLFVISLFVPVINPHSAGVLSTLGLIAPFIYVAMFVLTLYWILRWSWVAVPMILLSVISLFSLSLFYRPELKRHYDIKFPRGTIKVMTYNTRSFINDNGERCLDSIAELIDEVRPDIICFQEMGFSGLVDSMLQPMRYKPLPKSLSRKDLSPALYSRHPVIAAYRIDTMKNFVWADVVVNKDTIRVFNNHLHTTAIRQEDEEYIENHQYLEEENNVDKLGGMVGRLSKNNKLRSVQADTIASIMAQSPYPVIVCGDFNDIPISYTYRRMSRMADDAFRKVGRGYSSTYRGFFDMLRIDYVLLSEEFTPLGYDVINSWIWTDRVVREDTVRVRKYGENLTPRLDEGEEGPYAVDYSDHYPVLVHFSINR